MTPTPYADVNAILLRLRDGVRDILGNDLIGVYVTGSLAWGGYEPGASDIDALVAVYGDLTSEAFAELRRFHEGLRETDPPLSHRMDVPYLDPGLLSGRSRAAYPMVDSGVLAEAPYSTEIFFDRHIARERGIVLHGPPPREIIAPITADELRQATRDLLLGPWTRNLLPEQDDWLRPRHRQAFAILSMCRALHTFETGELLSKPDAAAWALRSVDARWLPLIERALPWRFDRTPDDADETRAFMRFVVNGADDPT